jgi:membrane protein
VLKHWSRARRFLDQELWTVDLATRPPLDRLRLRLLRLAVVVVWEVRHGVLNLRAMGLVYTTLLSLVPFIAVTVSVLKAFGFHYQVQPIIDRGLAPLGPSGQQVSAQLVSFVDNLKVGVLGAVGVAGLFFTVISLLEKIEEALNHIWRVRRPRSFARKFTDYLSVVLVGPVLVFAAFAFTAVAESFWITQWLLGMQPVSVVAAVVGNRLIPFLMVSAALAFLYRVIPYTEVRLDSALVGGATAGLLWQVSSSAFTRFVAGSAQYEAIYSGFAILVVFLIWLYVAWLVVLIGAEVAYFYQHPYAYLTLALMREHRPRFRERLALMALTAVARRHLGGERPWQPGELAEALRVPPSSLEGLIDDFVRGGIVLWAAEPPGLALARPPEQVTAFEILELVNDPEPVVAMSPEETDAVAALLRQRDQAVRPVLERVTLRALAAEPPGREPLAEVVQLPLGEAASRAEPSR